MDLFDLAFSILMIIFPKGQLPVTILQYKRRTIIGTVQYGCGFINLFIDLLALDTGPLHFTADWFHLITGTVPFRLIF